MALYIYIHKNVKSLNIYHVSPVHQKWISAVWNIYCCYFTEALPEPQTSDREEQQTSGPPSADCQGEQMDVWQSSLGPKHTNTHNSVGSVTMTITTECDADCVTGESEAVFSPEGPGGLQLLWASAPALHLLLQRRTSEESFPAGTNTSSVGISQVLA